MEKIVKSPAQEVKNINFDDHEVASLAKKRVKIENMIMPSSLPRRVGRKLLNDAIRSTVAKQSQQKLLKIRNVVKNMEGKSNKPQKTRHTGLKQSPGQLYVLALTTVSTASYHLATLRHRSLFIT